MPATDRRPYGGGVRPLQPAGTAPAGTAPAGLQPAITWWSAGRGGRGDEADHRPALFVDRDGTLIRDVGYLRRPEQVELLEPAVAALTRLTPERYRLVIVSNQSAVGRGWATRDQVQAVDEVVRANLAGRGIEVAASLACPHGPDDRCPCRKPLPGLLELAAEQLGLDLSAAVAVGNAPRDAWCGLRAGCRLAIHLHAEGPPCPEAAGARFRCVEDWGTAADLLD